ncbi:MAG: hypothetical protein JWN64_833 [Parcubacteria group bacterium]|nr:hypothetical protein [Parcubacteria group bacterium]
MKKRTRTPAKKSVRTAKRTGIYPFLVSIPDRLYPFSTIVEGKRVRWQASYNHALALARKRLGPGHYGYRVLAYRQACHFIGALGVIVVSTFISKELFGSDVAIYVLLVLAIVAVSYQEFYLHPRYYGQLWRKSVADWLVWTIPIGIYLFTHLH